MAATERKVAQSGPTGSSGPAGRSAAAWTPRKVADELAGLFAQLSETYTSVLESLEAHAAALAAADTQAVGRCVSDQEQLLARVAHIDQRRREIVAGACSCVPELAKAAAAGPLTVSAVASALATQDVEKLLEAGTRVKQLIEHAKQRSEGVRTATAVMLAHVEGLMRHVGRKMSHSGTYGRRGVVEVGQQVVSALDMKS